MSNDPESDLIQTLFRPAALSAGALGLLDDAALLSVPSARQVVLSKDVLVEGVHFLAKDPPEDIAAKAFGVNLSDLAAMAATPVGILSGLALPADHLGDWLVRYAGEQSRLVDAFHVPLLGGDITSTPGPLTISITAIGTVRQGAAMTRSAARPGDIIAVSGTIGDAALGLKVCKGALAGDTSGYLIRRYRRPQPRLELGADLSATGAAGMDISDGLVGDLTRLCRSSGTGAVIEMDRIPLSDAALSCLRSQPDLRDVILTGGDDYELLVSAPETVLQPFLQQGRLTMIGRMTERREQVRVILSSGTDWVPSGPLGYTHFSSIKI